MSTLRELIDFLTGLEDQVTQGLSGGASLWETVAKLSLTHKEVLLQFSIGRNHWRVGSGGKIGVSVHIEADKIEATGETLQDAWNDYLAKANPALVTPEKTDEETSKDAAGWIGGTT